MNTPLQSVPDVIDALGGIDAVARLTDRDPMTVYQWWHRRRFSTKTILTIQAALKQQGLTASPSLWGVDEMEPEVA
jgi:hypothetical protein